MDIQELNKTQLILLTLLITFVVSIATGIITVSLMQQVPKSVPQTINNVIQLTIEKVSTPATLDTPKDTPSFTNGDALVSIYLDGEVAPSQSPIITEPKALGQGVIISDLGLILVDSSLLIDKDTYKVILNKVDFSATLIKKFNNGFSILKITQKKIVTEENILDKKTTSNVTNQ